MKIKKQIQVHDKSLVHIPAIDVHLRIVDACTHLGGKAAHDGKIAPEIMNRVAKHFKATGPLKKTVFRAKALSITKKAMYGDSIAGSTLFFNSATWPVLESQLLKKLDTALEYRARCTANMSKIVEEKKIPLSDVLSKTNISKAEDLLRVSRLQYLPRVAENGPSHLKSMIAVEAMLENSFSTTLLK